MSAAAEIIAGIPENLRRAIAERGQTVRTAALSLGKGPTALRPCSDPKGNRVIPIELAAQLAALLEMSVDELLTGRPPDNTCEPDRETSSWTVPSRLVHYDKRARPHTQIGQPRRRYPMPDLIRIHLSTGISMHYLATGRTWLPAESSGPGLA